MDSEALLNEFPLMDPTIFSHLTALVRYTDKLLNVKEIYTIILRKQPSGVIEPLRDEAKIFSLIHDYLSGKTRQTPNELHRAREAARQLRSDKADYLQEKEREFFTNVAAAYIKNCVRFHFSDIPLDFLSENILNIRFGIERVHHLAGVIKAENPKGFDNFRRTYADIFNEFPNTSSRSHSVLFSLFYSWYSERTTTTSWDRVVAAMMVTAHCVCTIIKKNGVTNAVKTKSSELMHELYLFLSRRQVRLMLLQPDSWRNIELLRDMNNAVVDLDIPDTHQIFDRNLSCMGPFIRHLNAGSMQKALEEFNPLESGGFLGVCGAPVPKLATLCYNFIRLNCEDRLEYILHGPLLFPEFEIIP